MAGTKKKHSGRHMAITLYDPMDVYRFAAWEVARLERLLKNPEGNRDHTYAAISAAVWIWHIGDWVAGTLDDTDGWDAASTALGRTTRSKADIQELARTCRALVACQQIATAAKHLAVEDRAFRPGYKTVAMDFVVEHPPQVPGGEIHYEVTYAIFVWHAPDPVVGPRPSDHQRIEEVFAEALAWWRDVLTKLGMLQDESISGDQV